MSSTNANADLRDHQRAPQRARAAAGRAAASFLAQHDGEIRRQHVGDRNQPEHEADRRRRPPACRRRRRRRAGSPRRAAAPGCSACRAAAAPRSRRAARRAADSSVRSTLSVTSCRRDAQAAGAEREPRRELLQPRARSHQHEVGDVDAADQQHEQRAAPHQVQRRLDVAHQRCPAAARPWCGSRR